MAVAIHSTAQVENGAELGADVSVGAFAIVESGARLGDRTSIGAHAVVRGHTEMGADNQIFPFASIGEAPQHLEYAGEPTQLRLGDRNIIREYCTLHRGTSGRGTAAGRGVTLLGDDNFIMAYAHIAHDCVLGDRVIFANGASLAGHVEVGDNAVLGGFTMVHQFCNIGAHCITGIGSVCLADVPPYMVAAGNTAAPHGLNTKGLRRRNFSEETIAALKQAYKLLYRSRLDLRRAITEIDALDTAETRVLSEFLRASKRGIIR